MLQVWGRGGGQERWEGGREGCCRWGGGGKERWKGGAGVVCEYVGGACSHMFEQPAGGNAVEWGGRWAEGECKQRGSG